MKTKEKSFLLHFCTVLVMNNAKFSLHLFICASERVHQSLEHYKASLCICRNIVETLPTKQVGSPRTQHRVQVRVHQRIVHEIVNAQILRSGLKVKAGFGQCTRTWRHWGLDSLDSLVSSMGVCYLTAEILAHFLSYPQTWIGRDREHMVVNICNLRTDQQ